MPLDALYGHCAHTHTPQAVFNLVGQWLPVVTKTFTEQEISQVLDT